MDEIRKAIAESLRTAAKEKAEKEQEETEERAEQEWMRAEAKKRKRKKNKREEEDEAKKPEKEEVNNDKEEIEVEEEEPTKDREEDKGTKGGDDSVFSAIVLPFVTMVFLLGLLGTLVKGVFMLLYEFLVYAANVNILPFKALYYRSFGRIFAARSSMPNIEKRLNEDSYTASVKQLEAHNKAFIETLRRRLLSA